MAYLQIWSSAKSLQMQGKWVREWLGATGASPTSHSGLDQFNHLTGPNMRLYGGTHGSREGQWEGLVAATVPAHNQSRAAASAGPSSLPRMLDGSRW